MGRIAFIAGLVACLVASSDAGEQGLATTEKKGEE
jgi:hypothetical protein